MSAYAVFGDALVSASSARIPREEVAVFRAAGALYEQAKTFRDATEAEAETARGEGYAAGKAEALAEMRSALGEALSQLSESFAAENARRQAEVAWAAMQAVEQLIGTVPEAEQVAGIARQALGQRGSNTNASAVRVHVAPEWAAQLRDALGREDKVEVRADPALDRFACRVVSDDGRIIADLETQLAVLRERWGIGGDEGRGNTESDANG